MKTTAWFCVLVLFFFPIAIAQTLPPTQAPPHYTPSRPQTPITTTPVSPKVTTSLINGTWPFLKNAYQETVGVFCNMLAVVINTLITGGLNIATIAAWLQSCAAGAASLVSGLGGGLGAVISIGVSLLNAVGSAFVLFLQGIGFTIEGILGLAAIGAILSLIVNIVNFAYTTVMGLVNLAYTSGVGGIAIASLLLALINMALSAVLIVIDIILLIAVLVLYAFSGILFFVLVAFAPIVFFITGVIFFFFGLVTLAFKLQAMLSNLAAFPTGLITSFFSLLTAILNLGSMALVLFFSGVGLIISIYGVILNTILSPIIIIISGLVSLGLIIIIFILAIILGAILGGTIGLLFFIIGAIPGIIIGAIIGGVIGLLLVFVLCVLVILAAFATFIQTLLLWIFILPAIYIIIFVINLILSIGNFGEIMIESVVGVLTIIVNSIMLMFIKMFVDMLEITAISEIVSVVVMFLQRLQESAPLTKIVAYPLEMLLGVVMLLFAIVLAGCNIVLYPVNFVWQFISRSLSSCYRIMCGPFLRPLGYEVSWI